MTPRSRTRYTAASSQHIWLSREYELPETLLLRHSIAILALSDPNTRAATCSRFDYPEPSTACYAHKGGPR